MKESWCKKMAADDVNKICRAMLMEVKTEKDRKKLIIKLEAIVGADNVAFVNDKIREMENITED